MSLEGVDFVENATRSMQLKMYQSAHEFPALNLCDKAILLHNPYLRWGNPPHSKGWGTPCLEGYGYPWLARMGYPLSAAWGTPSSKCEQTDTCENSTFPIPSECGRQ